jgi:hypothetical protein
MKFVGQNFDFGSRPGINVPDPSNPQDVASKNYVDNLVRGFSWKVAARAASTGNLTLSGTQTVDGVAVVANDRVFVKDQTTASTNGVYVVGAGAWARATDADSPAELGGMTITILEGTVNAGRSYTMAASVPDPIVVGTTALTYAIVGGGVPYTAGNGLALTGNDFNIGAGTGIVVGADTVGIDPAVVARKSSTTIGNGALTAIPVVHNLNTRDVMVVVRDATTYEKVWAEDVATDANTVTVSFATAPTTGQYRVTVFG